MYAFKGYPNDAGHPYYVNSLVASGTVLYGMTQWGGANSSGQDNYGMGTLFKFDTNATSNPCTVLHSFAGGTSDGAHVYGTPTLSGTSLYGTTDIGGASGLGTIFKFDTRTNDFSLLYSFAGYPNDGAQPNTGPLTASGKNFYGTTWEGGATLGSGAGLGTIFKFDPTKKTTTVLHSFAGSPNDGAYPASGVVVLGTALYGMTYYGGANPGTDLQGLCTIFKFDTTKKTLTVLHSFAGGSGDGARPIGRLIVSGTVLYGMTYQGGADNLGTIFMFNTKTGGPYTILHSFAGGAHDGAHPFGSLNLVGTTLYGLTSQGGIYSTTEQPNGGGTIFSIPTAPLATIGGTVTTAGGADPIPGATVTLSQPKWSAQATTNDAGWYSFTDLTPGKYIVKAAAPGYAITPKSAVVPLNGSDVTDRNFTGTPVTISGTVTFNGQPVNGQGTTPVIVNLGGVATQTYTPDSTGYIFSYLANGKYTVTPTITHPDPMPKASPPSATIVINGKSVTRNFTYKMSSTCKGCH